MVTQTLEAASLVKGRDLTLEIENGQPFSIGHVARLLDAIQNVASSDECYGRDVRVEVVRLETGSLTAVLRFYSKHVEKAAATMALVTGLALLFQPGPSQSQALAQLIADAKVKSIVIVTDEHRISIEKNPLTGQLEEVGKARSEDCEAAEEDSGWPRDPDLQLGEELLPRLNWHEFPQFRFIGRFLEIEGAVFFSMDMGAALRVANSGSVSLEEVLGKPVSVLFERADDGGSPGIRIIEFTILEEG